MGLGRRGELQETLHSMWPPLNRWVPSLLQIPQDRGGLAQLVRCGPAAVDLLEGGELLVVRLIARTRARQAERFRGPPRTQRS